MTTKPKTFREYFLESNRANTKNADLRLLYAIYALTRKGPMWDKPIPNYSQSKWERVIKRILKKAMYG